MNKLLLGLGVLIALCAGVFVYLDRTSNGIVGFYAWKLMPGNLQTEARVDINGISVYYETYGDGSPVLVLHGGSAFIETMHNQITALADHHFVVAPDSRAHGRTGDADGVPLSYAQMADDMIALMDHMGLAKADIVGWSDGGNIGIDIAIRYPTRVGKLVTYGSNFHTNGLVPDEEGAGINSSPDDPSWEVVRSFYQSVAPNPDHWPVFHGKLMTMWDTQPTFTTDDLGRISSPVLVMAGEFDSIKETHTREMAASIPNGSLVIVEGEDHFAPLMAPEKVTPRIVEFLR
ncbi:MAG: alpha/beta hydrolase [Parvibaculaceae bacterium]|nr:alpha/beta hydrolase [Parvibaculaceae bacterium]HBM87070.1 alpha/beta hydrolase [Rhodobiaceae bacterium]